ncbi:fructose-6-phosphate aldolase [Candidatus Woesearchaeota archaeon]|nr:fructose-6-phosphate aldolase [Candidatus Woesearchaeota archaeon]
MKMEIFADTADLGELNELISLGVVDGCTTNPIIMAKAGNKNANSQMQQILKLIDGPVSLEVTTNDLELMLSQARNYAKMGNNVVVKLPMNIEGLKAVAILSKENIKTNVTACMSTKQAVIAAKAGATYVSLFWARIADMGYDAKKIVTETAEIFRLHNFRSKIIIGSFRQVSQINDALLTGAHVLTIPTNLLNEMVWNPRTESTIQEFIDKWDNFQKTQ